MCLHYYVCVAGKLICDFIGDLDCEHGLITYQVPGEGNKIINVYSFTCITCCLLLQGPYLIFGVGVMLHKLTVELCWHVLHWKAIIPLLRIPGF